MAEDFTTPLGMRNGIQTWNFHIINGDLRVRSDSVTEGIVRMTLTDLGDGEGRVGIGTIYPTHDLHVQGNISATGAVTSASDERLKTNIEPITEAMRLINELKAVRFEGNAEFPDKISRGPHIGFIGQQVANIVPEIVFNDDDDYLFIDYSHLTPILTRAIQEQNELIENMSEKIDALFQRIEILESHYPNA